MHTFLYIIELSYEENEEYDILFDDGSSNIKVLLIF